MVSLISPAYSTLPYKPTSHLSSPCLVPINFAISPPKRHHPLRLRSKELKQKRLDFYDCCGVVRMCKMWEGEGDTALEMEVFEFMKNSKNPEKFPKKSELVEAGRVDLVEAIVRRGGWMAMGWEVDEDVKKEIENGLVKSFDFGYEKYGKNGGSYGKLGKKDDRNGERCSKNGGESEGRNGLVKSFDFGHEKYDRNGERFSINGGEGEGRKVLEVNGGEHVNVEGVSFLGNSTQDASSSGRSLEMEADNDSGIEGILNRLEKQRKLSFGITLGKNGSMNRSHKISIDVDSCLPEASEPAILSRNVPMFSNNGSSRSHSTISSSSNKADTWRTWSNQRAGFSEKEFEAAEIDFGGDMKKRTLDESVGETVAVPGDIMGDLKDQKDLESCVGETAQIDVKSRLQYLAVELSSALSSFRQNSTDLCEKAKEQIPEDLRQLSDASEFQENEIMNSQGNLRSIRAKLRVLEGKMALAITDARKILEEKQRRIDDARRTFQLLRTICIVWPNSGTEVLLAGSFDGWATQRKMEKSSAGIFSLQLKLYPGKYEIKFIVDGTWVVDPLRPIVNNNGYENNLLIIS